jgi:hypothetical protein
MADGGRILIPLCIIKIKTMTEVTKLRIKNN